MMIEKTGVAREEGLITFDASLRLSREIAAIIYIQLRPFLFYPYSKKH